MRRKGLLSVVLSVAMVLGSSSPAFATGQMSSTEVTSGLEASASGSRDNAETEYSDQDESAVNSEKESANTQETAEEGEVGTEAKPEESSIKEASDKDSNAVAVEGAPAYESKKDSAEAEEEEPETLVGSEGERVSVGENVTAGFDSETGTVTFYSNGGTLSRNWVNELHIRYDEKDSIKEIIISNDSTVMYLPNDSSYLFSDCMGLQSLNLSKVDTSNVTNMSYMFYSCESLQMLDVGGFDTSNITDMSFMFSGCNSLQILDLSGFDTSNVKNMSGMFCNCYNLQTLDLSGFNTSNVTNMTYMFWNCYCLQSLNLSGFNTSNVTNMTYMFWGCGSLQTLDVSGFNTSNVTNMSYMFYDCGSLKILDVSGFDTSNVTDMSGMFCNCYNLQTLDVSGFDTSNVTNMSDMFSGCHSLQTLDVSGFDTSNVTDMYRMFRSCVSLQALDLSGFNTSNVTNMTNMFCNCYCLQSLNVSGFNTSNVTNMSYMFYYCGNLKILDVSGFDTSNVTDMSFMFYSCGSLKILDVSGFDTSNVTDMSGMFSYCLDLQTLDVSGFDTSNVTNMYGMFSGCNSLQTLDVSGFDTSNVTDMYGMFHACVSLQALDLSGFNTSNVTVMQNMFGDCSSLQTLDVSGFDTSNVTDMTDMFSDCYSLQTLDVSGFDMSNVTDMSSMFDGCNNLLVLITPVNVHITTDLPDTFVDASGTEYNSLPEGLSESLRLTKKGAVIPVDIKILSLSDDYYGKTGTQASFHIEAEGSGTISYRWQYRTAGMTNWKSPAQASAKTADYVFNLRPSYDNIEVRCIVSDESGNEIISDTRKANVFAFRLQPEDITASQGQSVDFTVSAIGRDVTYQWYYKRPNSTWKKAVVSGSKTAVLPITAGTKNDGTSYRCVITDEEGNKITSAAGALTLETPILITGMSEDAYDVNGKNVTFHIDAVGNGGLSYQWQYKLAGETKWRTPGLASAKTADYVFKLRPSYDNIEVRCTVQDAFGNSVTSDVRKANVFAITGQPQDTELALGEKTTFAVEAVGREMTYQWYYKRPEGSWKKVIVAGYNTAALVITANNKNDGTMFRCLVKDVLGNTLTSRAAKLTQ